NVARLILSNTSRARPEPRPQERVERWILARIDAARAEIEDDLAHFDFAHAVDRLYHLTFDDFCDWYAEAIKRRLYDGDEDAQATICVSSRRSFARARTPTATRGRRSSAWARRSPAPKACSRTSASCRTHPRASSTLSGRSSRATSGSSMLSPTEYVESLSPW